MILLLYVSSSTRATCAIKITHLVLASRGALKPRHGKERRHDGWQWKCRKEGEVFVALHFCGTEDVQC